MSRSIHTTRRTLRELRKAQFSDPVEKASALEEARRALWRKRRIKGQREEERSVRQPLPVAGGGAESIPVEARQGAEHERPHAHAAVSVGDVRAVLAALPAAAVEGLGGVRLELGRERMDDFRRGEKRGPGREDDDERDPFTGRRSVEIYPGVFAGILLGTYFPGPARIHLFDFVWDAGALPLPRAVHELYLRMVALTTLAHEVAHHHDNRRRTGRGRWLADRHENAECYAEKWEWQWEREVVIPYLERAYPEQTRAFLDWVETHGGLRLPLAFFAGDPRTTCRDGLVRWTSEDGHSMFESLVEEQSRCAAPADEWLAFAWELHYADRYEPCLRVLEKIIAQPSPAPERLRKALRCRADTLEHLERYDESLAAALPLVREDPKDGEAWEIVARAHEGKKEWPAVLETCDQWEAAFAGELAAARLAPEPPRAPLHPLYTMRWCHLARAIALCALGREAEMEVALGRMAESLRAHSQTLRRPTPERHIVGRLKFLRRQVFVRADRPAPPG